MAKDTDPYNRWLDAIYDMLPGEKKWLALIRPKYHTKYKLFSIGYKLLNDNYFPGGSDIFKLWKTSTKLERKQYICEALARPDPRLLHSNFYPRLDEQNAIYTSVKCEKEQLTAYLAGAKINLRNAYGSSQTLLEFWQQHKHDFYAFRAMEVDTDEGRVVAGHIDTGRRQIVRYAEAKQEGLLGPVSSYRQHLYHTGVEPAPTENDLITVNQFDVKGESRTPEGSRWVYEKTIYSAPIRFLAEDEFSRRVLQLFALVDEEGCVKEKMTVKIIGNKSKTALHRAIVAETDPHMRASALKCPYILEAYGSSIRFRRLRDNSPRLHLGYIYMEYAQFGDLIDLVNKTRRTPDKQIPEPYLWIIFRSLIEALHAMHTGVLIQDNTPVESMGVIKQGWDPIINPDIKLANVVLGPAQDDHYPAYKTVKMIDFGQVFPDEYVEEGWVLEKYATGTARICPPEQHFPYPEGYEEDPIGVHSEIYNVGLIMISLMQGVNKEILHAKNPRFPEGYSKCYSQSLEDLVTSCVAYKYFDRASLKTLIVQTRAGLANWEKAYGSANSAELPDFMRFDDFKEEQFPVGSKAPSKWGGPRKRKSEEMATPSDVPEIDVTPPSEDGGSPSKKSKTVPPGRASVEFVKAASEGKRGVTVSQDSERRKALRRYRSL